MVVVLCNTFTFATRSLDELLRGHNRSRLLICRPGSISWWRRRSGTALASASRVSHGLLCSQEFEDGRDARDALKDLDGYRLDGERIVVEMSRKYLSSPRWPLRCFSQLCRRGGGGYDDRDRGRGRSPPRRGGSPPRHGRFSPPHNTNHRLLARNLPPRADWRDLKDFFREAGRFSSPILPCCKYSLVYRARLLRGRPARQGRRRGGRGRVRILRRSPKRLEEA